MTAIITADFPMMNAMPMPAVELAGGLRRRRISPEAGHALEILGHAIEYLTDEYVHNGGSFSASNEQLQAVQILMALNRQVYFECPEVPSFANRCRSLFGFQTA